MGSGKRLWFRKKNPRTKDGPAICSNHRRKWSQSASRCWTHPLVYCWGRHRGSSSDSHLHGTLPWAARDRGRKRERHHAVQSQRRNGGRLLPRRCWRNSTRNPLRGHRSRDPRFRPRASLSAFGPSAGWPPRRGPRRPWQAQARGHPDGPQRRGRPTWRRRRQPGRRGHCSRAGPSCQPAPRPPSPGPPAAAPPARPRPAARVPRRGFSPATCPLPPGRGLLRDPRLGTRPLLCCSSPSPSSKSGRLPDPDRPHRLPQVPPSGLGGEGAGKCLRLSPP